MKDKIEIEFAIEGLIRIISEDWNFDENNTIIEIAKRCHLSNVECNAIEKMHKGLLEVKPEMNPENLY